MQGKLNYQCQHIRKSYTKHIPPKRGLHRKINSKRRRHIRRNRRSTLAVVSVRNVPSEGSGRMLGRGKSGGASASSLHLIGALPERDGKALGPEFFERGRKLGATNSRSGVRGGVCVGTDCRKNFFHSFTKSPCGF